jgi:hypothetical protein
MSTPPTDKEVRQARINEAVAEDVAVGMAAKADVAEARAEVLEAQNVRQSVHMSELRAERDGAAVSGALAREQARSSSFAFWLLLGVVVTGLALWALWAATRPEPTTSSLIITSPGPAATAAARPAPASGVPAATTAPAAVPAAATVPAARRRAR